MRLRFALPTAFLVSAFAVGLLITLPAMAFPTLATAQVDAGAGTDTGAPPPADAGAADGGAATPSATPDGGAAAPPAASTEPMSAQTYAVRLRSLEQEINALKEEIFRSKARLSLLAETVLQGVVAGAQAQIKHENRMSASYRLVKAVYALDGAPIFNKADEEGGLGERDEFDVYNGSIVPGEHTLTVNLEYRGHGYGIFSYLKGYRFKVRSNYTFTAPEGRSVNLRVVGYERGGPTERLENRPAIRYVEEVNRTSGGGGAAAATAEGGDGE